MIRRKKTRLFLWTICILYAFGYGKGEDEVTNTTEILYDDYFELTTNTIPEEDHTILDSDYTEISYLNNTQNFEETSNDIINQLEETTTELFICKDKPNSVENLSISEVNTTLVILTWQPVSSIDDCIILYNITWSSDNNDIEYITINSTESNFVISNLTPCTHYTISIVAIGENGGISDETILFANTTELEISQVNNLVVTGIEYGLNITWDSPEDSYYCLESYEIEILSEDNVTQITDIVSKSITSYTIDDLSACTIYTVKITPVSIFNSYGIASIVYNEETLPDVPGPINSLTVPNNQITQTSVYLTWSEPIINGNCVLYYSLNTCYDNICNTVNTVETYYNVTNLNPCITYTFIINAVGEAGLSDSESTTAETSYIQPGQPANITATPGQFSLIISWEPPAIGGTCTTSYRVTVWDTDQSSTISDTNITISNLVACRSYTTQITPISTIGEGIFNTVIGTTEASVNIPPLLDIDEPNVTKSDISIVWGINRIMNDCEFRNMHTICNFTSTNGHGFEFRDGQSEDDISSLGLSTNVTVTVTVSNLSPFSWYECIGMIENIAGNSTNSVTAIARTSEDVPSESIMNVTSIENAMFTLVWNEPDYLAGNLIEHMIFLSWKRAFLIPSSCDYNLESLDDIIIRTNGSNFEYIYTEALAYSDYNVTMRSRTNAGWGNYSDSIIFRTNPDVPGIVENIEYLNTTDLDNPNLMNTFLSWQLPCPLNGEIESFHIHFTGVRYRFEDHISETIIYNNVQNVTANKRFEINFGELYAEYNYTFFISSKVFGVLEFSPFATYSVTYPAGIPPIPKESYMNAITMNAYHAERTSSTAWVLLPVFEDTNGEIQHYAVMISEHGQSNLTEGRIDILSGKWPDTNSWHEAMLHNPIIPYQATPIRWNPSKTNFTTDYGNLQAVKFELGSNDSCSTISSISSFCNGPLRPDTKYDIVMRAFTNGGYRDSKPIFAKTKAEFNLGMVIGIIFGILFLGIITTMMLLVRKGVLQTVVSNILHRSAQGSPGPDPLTRKKFELHCQELIENPGKLSNEFQLLQTLSVDLEMSATAAVLQANRRKNRYINILPYDISRVKLEIINNDPNSDYINASLIPGYSGAPEYIACQGPKEETSYDFWRMIFQYNVKIIVMVTQLVEKGKDKCHQYYPNTRENFEYEDIMIRCSTQLDFVFYTQRIITLQKGNMKRTIMHLHFKEWSDHGVPDDIHSMINFCQITRKLMNDNKSLAVVHCSAGVGRTGTLIAIDILLQQIKDNKKLDIFGTVYRLRQHRMNMVQTESQYAYIYNCVKQALHNPYPTKHYMTTSVEPVYENLTKKGRGITDSNINLVNSDETLKKISPSLSTISMEPISENTVSQRPVYTTQLSTLSNGLRPSKSTGALDSQVLSDLQLDRYASHEYPVFEPAPDSPSGRVDTEGADFLDFLRPIRYDTKIARATSMNDDENTDVSIHRIKPT